MSRRDSLYVSQAPERFHWTDIPTGICFMIALLAAGLALAINFRPLYYLDISWLNLVEKSGFNAVVIKENYDILIDYCCPFHTGDLLFTIRASESVKLQEAQVEKFKKLEKKKIPEDIVYSEIKGLRLEARQKLDKIRPLSIGQASRISGVSPADISVLHIYIEQEKNNK